MGSYSPTVDKVAEKPVRGEAGRRTATLPHLTLRAPSGELAQLVERFYFYRLDAPVVEGIVRVDSGHIRFNLCGEGTVRFASGHIDRSYPVMVNGPGAASARYWSDGPFHCFGITLRPIGWRALIGVPAYEASERVLNGEALFGREALMLHERLRRMTTLDQMIDAVTPILLAHRRPVPKAHLELCRAVEEWSRTDALGVEALYARVPMSQRQVMRLCNEYFGGPPKHLERKFRAMRAALQIYRGADPGDVADSFCDQSHVIHEIKHFTGHTPTMLRSSLDPVVAATFETERYLRARDVFHSVVDPVG
jgi:AraC-like DNA-binding protein